MVILRSQRNTSQPTGNQPTTTQGARANDGSAGSIYTSGSSTRSSHASDSGYQTESSLSSAHADTGHGRNVSPLNAAASLRQPNKRQRLPSLVTATNRNNPVARLRGSLSDSEDSFIASSDSEEEMSEDSPSEASFDEQAMDQESGSESASMASEDFSEDLGSEESEDEDEGDLLRQFATRLADELEGVSVSRQEELNKIYGKPVAKEVWASLLGHVGRATEKIAQQYLDMVREVIELGKNEHMPAPEFFDVICQAQKSFDKIQALPGLADKLTELSQGETPLNETALAHIRSRFGDNTAQRTQRITRLSVNRARQAQATSGNNPTALSVDLKTLKSHIRAMANFEQVLVKARTAIQKSILQQQSGAKTIAGTNAKIVVLDGSLGLNDLIASSTVKDQIERLVDRLVHPETYAAGNIPMPNGILLAGEPGTGKTHMARIIASLATQAWKTRASTQASEGSTFIACNGADFAGPFVGSGVARMNQVIGEAKKRATATSPTFLFIDEFDALATDRRMSDNSREDDKTLNALLGALDGMIKDNNPVVLLAATNHLEKIDPAARRPGRIDVILKIDPPDSGQRFELLKLFADKYIQAQERPSDEVLKNFAQSRYTKGYTGAALEQLTITVMDKRIFQKNRNVPVPPVVSLPEYLDAMTQIKPGNVTPFPPSTLLINQTGNETQLPTLDEKYFDKNDSAALKKDLLAFFNDKTANPFNIAPTNKFYIHSKTTQRLMLAKAIAGTVNKPVFYADLRRMENKYIGESTASIAQLLEAADHYPIKPAVLVLDNLDYLIETEKDHSIRQGMLSQLTQRLNDPEDLRHLVVIGLSPLPAEASNPLVRLFSRQMELKGPDEKTRQSVLDEKISLEPHFFHAIDTASLAKKSKNFDHSKLNDWVNEAKKVAGQRFETATNKSAFNLYALPEQYKIGMADFETSLNALEKKTELDPSLRAIYS